jgi:hypothetical protein
MKLEGHNHVHKIISVCRPKEIQYSLHTYNLCIADPLSLHLRQGSRIVSPIESFLLCPIKLKTKLRGLSQRENYTDRATAACHPI